MKAINLKVRLTINVCGVVVAFNALSYFQIDSFQYTNWQTSQPYAQLSVEGHFDPRRYSFEKVPCSYVGRAVATHGTVFDVERGHGTSATWSREVIET